MQQVFIIHGGTTFASYDEFLNYLKTTEIDIDRMRSKDWKEFLPKTLGKRYRVLSPRMPNAQNAKYAEWKLWFERFIPFMQDGVILVGHSLGALFLTKYLSENNFSKKIRAVFLVAPPYDTTIGGSLSEFSIIAPLNKVGKQGGQITFYHSKDDAVVPFSEFKKYQKQLPSAQYRMFEDRGHFNQEEFPELVADIQSLNG